jgi:hypothetical protein
LRLRNSDVTLLRSIFLDGEYDWSFLKAPGVIIGDHWRCLGMRCSFAERRLKPSVGWFRPAESSLARLYLYLTKWTIIRAGGNVVKGRFSFLPIDMALWAYALWIATERTVKHIFARHQIAHSARLVRITFWKA